MRSVDSSATASGISAARRSTSSSQRSTAARTSAVVGPNPNARMRSLPSSGLNGRSNIAQSDSALVELSEVRTDGLGFGFGLSVSSLRDWVLPPTFVPTNLSFRERAPATATARTSSSSSSSSRAASRWTTAASRPG